VNGQPVVVDGEAVEREASPPGRYLKYRQ